MNNLLIYLCFLQVFCLLPVGAVTDPPTCYLTNNGKSWGNIYDDVLIGVDTDSSYNMYALVQSYGYSALANWGVGDYDFFLYKIDTTGTVTLGLY